MVSYIHPKQNRTLDFTNRASTNFCTIPAYKAACVDGTFTRYSFSLDGQSNRLSFDVFSEMTSVEDEE